jgi:hypothetical protein
MITVDNYCTPVRSQGDVRHTYAQALAYALARRRVARREASFCEPNGSPSSGRGGRRLGSTTGPSLGARLFLLLSPVLADAQRRLLTLGPFLYGRNTYKNVYFGHKSVQLRP